MEAGGSQAGGGRKKPLVYRISCGGTGNDFTCDNTYIGETARALKARAAEHQHPSSSTSEVSQYLHT